MEGNNNTFWGKKTICVVTGASQGIGRHFSVEFSRKFGPHSLLVILARSEDGLKETKKLINEVNSSVNVSVHPTDLSKPNADLFIDIINSALEKFKSKPQDFELAVIIHNAGSVGDVSQPTVTMSDPVKWQEYLNLNLISVSCLNSQFFKVFPGSSVKQRHVINITSLCGIQPMKSMGYYCTGKAAREMFFKVFAAENPSIKVLNYAPGPVNTDMIAEIIGHVGDAEVKGQFVTMKTTNVILSVDQTTKRAIEVITKSKYKSGDHVDYFDED